ncbi:rhodanese-like domain-containing protein [Mycobacterium simiae]
MRTPAEFETSHIAGSLNVPLDVPLDMLDRHGSTIAGHLERDD